MKEYAVLIGYKKVGKGRRKRTVPEFETVHADGMKIIDGCLIFFAWSGSVEETVQAFSSIGWLEVEEQEAD